MAPKAIEDVRPGIYVREALLAEREAAVAARESAAAQLERDLLVREENVLAREQDVAALEARLAGQRPPNVKGMCSHCGLRFCTRGTMCFRGLGFRV